MKKEEVWSKTRHFKIETDTEKLDLIDTDVYLDLLNKYNNLQHKLKEKNKIIDKIKDFLKEYHKYENRFKWCEQDYIDTILEIEKMLKEGE